MISSHPSTVGWLPTLLRAHGAGTQCSHIVILVSARQSENQPRSTMIADGSKNQAFDHWPLAGGFSAPSFRNASYSAIDTAFARLCERTLPLVGIPTSHSEFASSTSSGR